MVLSDRRSVGQSEGLFGVVSVSVGVSVECPSIVRRMFNGQNKSDIMVDSPSDMRCSHDGTAPSDERSAEESIGLSDGASVGQSDGPSLGQYDFMSASVGVSVDCPPHVRRTE